MSTKITANPPTRFDLQLLWSRIRGTALLNGDEIILLKEDTRATPQAVGVLVLATLCYGLGYSVFTSGQGLTVYSIIVGSLATMITSCFSALVWSIAIFFVGTKLFQGETKYWELARPLFFSTAPGIFLLLISIPVRPVIIVATLVAVVWLVISQAFVVKQVMGFGLRRTVLTLAVGFLILAFLGLSFQH